MKIVDAEFIQSAVSPEGFLRDGREVAFAGRSNVGKSSLLNRLLGRSGLARISSTPGRTQAVNYFRVNRRFYFVDLPGYGYARAGKQARQGWAELIERYLRQAAARVEVVLLVDGKVGATALDAGAYDYLAGLGLKIVVAATKMDQLPRGRWNSGLEAVRRKLGAAHETAIIPFSAKTGEGARELWREIEAHLVGGASGKD